MKRVFFTGPVVKVLAAFAGIVGVGLIAYFMSSMPAPREQDRVTSAGGEISIIRPRDWDGKAVFAPPGSRYTVMILCEPPKAVGIGPRLVAGLLRQAPLMSELKSAGWGPGKFQDQDAMLLSVKNKRDFFWQAVFERNGNWYELVLRLDAAQDIPSSPWWPYLTSFRAGGSSTLPASRESSPN